MEYAKIVSTDTELTTPHGTFNTMVIEVTDTLGARTLEYYAPGIGLVRLERTRDAVTQYYHLINIVESTLNENMEIFLGWTTDYEIDEDGEIYEFPVAIYDYMHIDYSTNNCLPTLFTQAFKTYLLEAFGHVVNLGAAINSIYADRWEAVLHIDLTPAFAVEMSAMGEDELLFLQLFADTMGYHYNTIAVSISIDGGPYVSERITLDPANGDLIILTSYQAMFEEHDIWD
jgi:hypothetical protein